MKSIVINSVWSVKRTGTNPHHTNTHLSYSQMKLIIDVTRLTQVAAFGDQPVPAFPHPSLKVQEFVCLRATREFSHCHGYKSLQMTFKLTIVKGFISDSWPGRAPDPTGRHQQAWRWGIWGWSTMNTSAKGNHKVPAGASCSLIANYEIINSLRYQ